MQNAQKVLLTQILKTVTTALIHEESEGERSLMVGSYLDLVLLFNLPLIPSDIFLKQIVKTTLKALVYEDCETERSLIVGTYYELLEKLE